MASHEAKTEAAHKFKIGEVLRFHSRLRLSGPANALYRVVGHRPPEDGEPSYRIKSDMENHERIARQSELS
jgi:hypothetical protein